MDIYKRIEVFAGLGKVLSLAAAEQSFEPLRAEGLDADSFSESFNRTKDVNAWFTDESIFKMLYSLGVSLNREDIERWAGMYEIAPDLQQKTVAVVMAGNIPAVGFHDFLSVLMSGHKVLAKLSSDDPYLIPAIADVLIEMEPAFAGMIDFTEDTISGFDAVIATGSNNTARYFDYYFGRYPHIIRKNRNALAVLSGNETKDELRALGDDIFMYYGLGCRNVSKFLVPRDFDFKDFFEAIQDFSMVLDHHKYNNNYDYNKSIFLVNGDPHFDNGFLLLKEGAGMTSPVSVLHYERYDSLEQVDAIIKDESDNIQCVITTDKRLTGSIPPGTGQYPKLWDYADGVDTMEFLLSI